MTNEEVLEQLQHLIGQPYVASVKAYICELTARPVVGAGEVASKEFDSTRIHVVTNASGTIEAFNFG